VGATERTTAGAKPRTLRSLRQAQVQAEKAAVMRWPDESASDFDANLYMTLPATAGEGSK
jgi:hypothetical protein